MGKITPMNIVILFVSGPDIMKFVRQLSCIGSMMNHYLVIGPSLVRLAVAFRSQPVEVILPLVSVGHLFIQFRRDTACSWLIPHVSTKIILCVLAAKYFWEEGKLQLFWTWDVV